MHRFFLTDIQLNQPMPLPEDDHRHASRVLRLKAGDDVRLFDGSAEYAAQVVSVTKGQTLVQPLYALEADREPACKLTLYQSCPKGDKYEGILQKCTEVGVSRFAFFESARSVAKLSGNKLERMQRITYEAAKQSGRLIVPEVALLGFGEVLAALPHHAQALCAWESEKTRTLKEAIDSTSRDTAIVIGPEGGFEAAEVEAMQGAGAQVVTLGKRILRTETAGLVLASILLHETGDMT